MMGFIAVASLVFWGWWIGEYQPSLSVLLWMNAALLLLPWVVLGVAWWWTLYLERDLGKIWGKLGPGLIQLFLLFGPSLAFVTSWRWGVWSMVLGALFTVVYGVITGLATVGTFYADQKVPPRTVPHEPVQTSPGATGEGDSLPKDKPEDI